MTRARLTIRCGVMAAVLGVAASSAHAGSDPTGQLVFDASRYAGAGFAHGGSIQIGRVSPDLMTTTDAQLSVVSATGDLSRVPIEATISVRGEELSPFVIDSLGTSGCDGSTPCTQFVDLTTGAAIGIRCEPSSVGNKPGTYSAILAVRQGQILSPSVLSNSTMVPLSCVIAPDLEAPTSVTGDADMPGRDPGPDVTVQFRGLAGTSFVIELPSGWTTKDGECSGSSRCQLPFPDSTLVAGLPYQALPVTFQFSAALGDATPDVYPAVANVYLCGQGCNHTPDASFPLRGVTHGGTVTPDASTLVLPSANLTRTTSTVDVTLHNLGDRTVGFEVTLVPGESAVTPFALVPGSDANNIALHTLDTAGVAAAPVQVTCDRHPMGRTGPFDVPVGNYTARLDITGSNDSGRLLGPYSPYTPPTTPILQLHGPSPAETFSVPLACIVSDARVAPEVIDFHTLVGPLVDDSAPVTVSITNESTAPIDVASLAVVDVVPAGLLVKLDAATLARGTIAPGEVITFDVVVDRTAGIGRFSGAVTFTTTEGGTVVAWRLPVVGEVRDDLGPPPGDPAEPTASYYACSTGGAASGSGALGVGLALILATRRRRAAPDTRSEPRPRT